MQFLTADGKVFSGVPLTDDQVKLRPEITTLLHLGFCDGDHPNISYPLCGRIADRLLTTYAMVRFDSETEARGKVYVPKDPPPDWMRGPIKPAAGKEQI
jgi:hypothetical protein